MDCCHTQIYTINTIPGESKKVYTFNEPQKSDHCIDTRNLTWIQQSKPEIRS